MKVKSESEVAQSCPTLCSLPGSSIHGIFQARVLEWGTIAFSEFKFCFLKLSGTFFLNIYHLRMWNHGHRKLTVYTPPSLSPHTHNRVLTIKKYVIIPLAATWMDLEIIRDYQVRDKYHMMALVFKIWYKWTYLQNRNRLTHRHREGNGNPLQYSCLENPRDRGAWWAAVYGVAQSQTRLKRLSSSSTDRPRKQTYDYLRGKELGVGWVKKMWCMYI